MTQVASGLDLNHLAGTVVGGRYVLHTWLGEGGFGVVYQATQTAFGRRLREVAIKIAKEPVPDRDAAHAFGDGFMSALVIDAAPEEVRRHFVAVYDAGCGLPDEATAGHPYLVMEHVAGSLESCLAHEGPFPLARAIQYFDQILTAVAYLHGSDPGTSSRGTNRIVHRDLKPANVLIARRHGGSDCLKLTDFGLAAALNPRTAATSAAGTMAYWAPECLTAHEYTPQSEVYTLALIFYEMVNGSNPFRSVAGLPADASFEEKCTAHRQVREAERFSTLTNDAELSRRPGIHRVIRTALALDPVDRRYADAHEFRVDWDRVKHDVGSVRDEASPDTSILQVARLTRQAREYFRLGQESIGWERLQAALALNRDKALIPDHWVVGATYLLAVEQLLSRGEHQAARAMAWEGHRRRQCRSTLSGMALVQQDPRMRELYEADARACPDHE